MLMLLEPYADYILSVCHTVICLGIIPTIWTGRREQHIPYATSLTFIIVLSVLGLALLSQGLVFGAATDMLGAGLWCVVAGERRLWQRRERRSASRRTRLS